MMGKRLYTEEEARERKNARQREYAKRTGYVSCTKYNKEHTKLLNIRFTPTDMYLFDYLNTLDNKSGYIKELIEADYRKRMGQ